MTLYLDDQDVADLMPMADAIQCVDQAFRLLAAGIASNEVRHRTKLEDFTLSVMWSIAPSIGFSGVKSYPVAHKDSTKGSVLTLLLYSTETGELLAILKADKLGQIRTGAASAVATRALGRPEAQTLAIYGTGFQAETQALAVASVLPQLRTVLVVGRDAERRAAFVSAMRPQLSADILSSEPSDAAGQADVIVTATGASEPVLRGAWIKSGVHVNAVGSNLASKRELDRDVLRRTHLIAVDDAEVAKHECGDLIANQWNQDDVVPLGSILNGDVVGRRKPDDVTLFESQGLALQDVACAAVIYARAIETGRGRHV